MYWEFWAMRIPIRSCLEWVVPQLELLFVLVSLLGDTILDQRKLTVNLRVFFQELDEGVRVPLNRA